MCQFSWMNQKVIDERQIELLWLVQHQEGSMLVLFELYIFWRASIVDAKKSKYIRDGVVNMTLCNWQLKLEIIMSLLCSNTVKKLSKYVVIILLKFHLLPLLSISTFLVHLLLNFDCCWHQIPWFFLDALTNKYR